MSRDTVAFNIQRIAGCFSLAVGQIDSLEAPDRVRKAWAWAWATVVILARLAVSLVDQGRGLGVSLLQEAILARLRLPIKLACGRC